MGNREIKFRAWDSYSKSFYYLKVKDSPMGEIHLDTPQDIRGLMVQPKVRMEQKLEWQQYSGLTDKHGREIYEGDVVRFTNYYNGKVYEQGIGIVELGKFETVGETGWNGETVVGFYLCKAVISVSSHLGTHSMSLFNWDELEVIGNIHENPDLVEGK